jgi:metal-responsive CopG/Arc/MetJ family transcriptional regulator
MFLLKHFPTRQFIKVAIIVTMQKNISKGISLPIEVLRKIDSLRGDVSRSKFLLRMLERLDITYNNSQNSTIRGIETMLSDESEGL